MRWVSQILAVIPDPSGATQIAALVSSILSNVDVIRLANIVGQIQEIAWAALEKLFPPPGIAPDPVGAGAAMSGLLPVGLDLASVAVDMLSGKATKTPPPELLGKQANAVSTSITTQAANLDLPQLSDSLVTLSQSQGAQDLAALVSEGSVLRVSSPLALTPTTTLSWSTTPGEMPSSGSPTGSIFRSDVPYEFPCPQSVCPLDLVRYMRSPGGISHPR